MGDCQADGYDFLYLITRRAVRQPRRHPNPKQFQVEELASPPSFKINDSIRDTQTQKINQLKAKRNNNEVNQSLEKLKAACSSPDNLMPYILDAVEQYATLGEIADILRSEFGEFA